MCKSCRTCFMFYCMFYFTCDRSFIVVVMAVLRIVAVVYGVAALVHNLKISLSTIAVRGVALLANELYVLRVGGKSSDVAVYETRSFSLERRLTVPGLRAACDMAACERAVCLYVADRGTDMMHKVDRIGDSSQWPIGEH